MTINPIEMTPSRLHRLKNFLIANSKKSSRQAKERDAAKQIKTLIQVGGLKEFYIDQCKHGHIADKAFAITGDIMEVPLATRSPNLIPDSEPQKPVLLERKKKVPRLVHFDPDVLEELKILAHEKDCTASYLIRLAVNGYLEGLKVLR